MAKSGSKSVEFTSWDDLKFSWWEISQDVAKNQTKIGWKMELVAGSSGRISASATCPWAVTVNGKNYDGDVNVGIGNNQTKTLAEDTTTITHNTDGSKTFSYSFEQYFGITFSGKWITTVSGSGSGTLDPIYRTSQPSCITWPEHTQNVGYFGDTISIHMNRQSSALTHTVRYQFGSKSGTIATNVGTGTTWTIPLDLMDLIPNSTSGSGTIYADVYADGTKLGTASCGFTAKVPDSVKPSCSFTLDDVTDIDQIYGSPVKGLSKIKVTVTGTMAYSSPIKSCTIELDGVKYSGMEITGGALKTAGKSTVKATVTDGRGRSGSVSYDMTVQDYDFPKVSVLTVIRCNEDGTENDQGGYAKITFSAAVSSMNNLNTAEYSLRHKQSSDDNWTEVPLSSLKNKYTVTGHTYIFAADDNSSYDVEVSVTDKHSTTIRSTSVSTAFTLMNWHEDGTSMAIGKVSEGGKRFEVALDAVFYGKVSGTIFDAIYPIGSIYLAYNHTNPGTLFPGTTWERIEEAFPWFTGSAGTIGQTGGEKTHTLTIDEMPEHQHGGVYSGDSSNKQYAWYTVAGDKMGYSRFTNGGNQPHNNMPPYIQISAWRRTA